MKKLLVKLNWEKGLFSDVIMQTSKNIFADSLNFPTECIGGQIKAFSFLFCIASDVKSTKGGGGGGVLIYRVIAKQ